MAVPAPTHLLCEYFSNPLGIDTLQPRLSWQVADPRRGARQNAYQILVASSPEKLAAQKADVWDSGRVASDQSLHVPYGGPALRSRQRCYWTVRVWDHSGAVGEPSAYAAPACWEMGLLAPTGWSASWIGSALVGSKFASVPAPFLRKTFTFSKPLASARLYATALGLYESYINGERVGHDVFTPGWTEYRKRVQYQTYDVTALLSPGANALGAILGDGWYCGHVGGDPRQVYGDRPKFFAQLVLTFTDGSTQTIATDATWKTTSGPIVGSDLLMGESYDARLELPGWSTASYDDARWLAVETFPAPDIALVAPPGPPVRVTQELAATPLAKRTARGWGHPGTVFDLGQNMVGRIRLKVHGPAGTTITIRHAEVLNPDGTLYVENLRSAKCTDHYTLKGSTPDNPEIYEPHFTFHGFRYVELAPQPPLPDAALTVPHTVTGVVLHSDTPPTGDFECSDPLLNQLQRNIQWGQRGNFLEVPTDCPQRDERLGWTGDAQVFIRTATHNMNVAPFFTKWFRDLADDQNGNGSIPPVIPDPNHNILSTNSGEAAWADAVLICPWTVYLAYGDTRVLETHYPVFQKFANYLLETSKDFTRGAHTGLSWEGFGDWLATDAGRDNTFGMTPRDLLNSAFFAHAMRLMSRIASVLHKAEDAARYGELFEKSRAAFVRRFVTPAGFIHGHTQTGYVLALHFDLLPENLRSFAAETLVKHIKERGDHLSTGFVGTPYINHVLTATNHLETAYALLLQKEWPSWLYSVTQGATTIWERWDGWTHDKGFQTPGMNSFNHYAYGAIGHWLYNTVAGLDLDPERPGYKHMIIYPRPGGGLTQAKATLHSLYGLIQSAWRVEGERFVLEVIIPANTSATVHLPATDPAGVTESGQPLGAVPEVRVLAATGHVTLEIPAGTYVFSCPGLVR